MDAAPVLSIVGDRTVSGLLRAGAQAYPDRPLLVYDDLEGATEVYSWLEVLRYSEALAALLVERGVRARHTVHVHLPNRPEFLFAWFAAAHLAAVIVPTNTAGAPHELAYIMGHARISVSITDIHGLGPVTAAKDLAGIDVPVLVAERDLTPERAATIATAPPARSMDDLGVIYTSGTTSRPKGVRVTHANYIYAGETVAAALRLGPEDRFLTVLPLFHANAQYYSTMGTLVSGGTIVLARRFTASGYADLAIRHRATVGSLFAAPIRMILGQQPHPRWRDHSLRVVAYAQNLTRAEHEAWDETLGAPLLQLYGMTETIGPPVMNSLVGRRRHDAIGRPVLGYTCRILRKDGSPATVGEPGELVVGGVPGVSLMAGYLDDHDATNDVMRAGWLSTGDLVRQDHDGLISFVGRTRDMIRRAGENVAAGEVEAVLLDHPMVHDAAVVGVPDPIRDEEIVAFVVIARGEQLEEEELREWCSERLASFRVPSHIAIQRELPRTAVGKVQKHQLRAAWEQNVSRKPV
jgi:crotonobetaine/carnitine-CoA ligase